MPSRGFTRVSCAGSGEGRVTHLRCILIATAIAGCSGRGQGRVTTIGRHRGPLDPSDSGFIGGMNYDPTDAPVAWMRTGDLLVAHREEFSAEDVFSTTCAGSVGTRRRALGCGSSLRHRPAPQ